MCDKGSGHVESRGGETTWGLKETIHSFLYGGCDSGGFWTGRVWVLRTLIEAGGLV